MAAKYVKRKAGRERADLRQAFAASFPLDALLPTLHVENVLTALQFAHLRHSRLTVVDKNHRFLEYLDKNLSAVHLTLSILARLEHVDYRYFGKKLRELFGVEEEEVEGTGGSPSAKRLKIQREETSVSGAGEVSTLWSPNTGLVQCSVNGLVLNEESILE